MVIPYDRKSYFSMVSVQHQMRVYRMVLFEGFGDYLYIFFYELLMLFKHIFMLNICGDVSSTLFYFYFYTTISYFEGKLFTKTSVNSESSSIFKIGPLPSYYY